MKLTNLKIGVQLRIGFGIIILLIVLLGGISWHQTNQIAQQTADLYDHPFQVRRAIGELKADILSMHRGMKDLGLAENNQEITLLLQDIETYKTDADKQFTIIFELYLGPRADVDLAYNDFVHWNIIREETILLIREGKKLEALARTRANGVGGNHVNIILKHIQVIDDFAVDKAKQFYTSTAKLKDLLNLQLAFLLAGILALTVIVVYFLNRNIRRPVIELARLTRLFREGKMDVRSTNLSTNEFGQLSVSFNDLADTIETEMTLNSQAAKLAGVMLSEDEAHQFCHALLSSLLEHTGAQMGAVFLLNDEKSKFERFECLGMSSDGCKPFSATHFEGEFGLALSTQQIQHITQIPEDTRFSFSTVSGQFIPREMITIPIVSGDETIAVISLATIKNFSENSLRLLRVVLSTLSARMDGILAYRKVVDFSRQLEAQNLELDSQQKELARRSEILSTANIELEAQKRELSAQSSELSEQNIELEMQKKQLDEANRLKSIFLSNMSHELRTPLNSVIALSGVLNRRLAGKVADEEYSYLDVIERNGKQLLALINDILDLSRIEAGREEVELKKFSITELIREVVEMIEPQAVQKNINLSYSADGDGIDITSDYEKCRHILQNIVANAVKFTETGGVEVTLEVKNNRAYIAVSDTGIGIAKEHLNHIFDEFRQADGSNSRKYGGTGLGLAIARKYAELLGGKIEVESIRGKGSRFTLSLPAQPVLPENDSVKYEANSHSYHIKGGNHYGAEDLSKKTILLVEDTEAIIIQMKDILASQGYGIMVAHNGTEALELIEHQIPDAMILDLMMPDVDGFEVLRRIREEEKTDHLPVIILTAKYVTKDELAFLKNNGILQLIQKGDINKDQLLEAVFRMVVPKVEEIQQPVKQQIPVEVAGTPVVLVVEDNPDNMLTIKALLGSKFTVLEAENGLAGIELARLHQPHLILMDIALPGINGIEALNVIRKTDGLGHVPVIAVTASAMKGDMENLVTLGFNAYISKPIDSVLFEKTIREFLG